MFKTLGLMTMGLFIVTGAHAASVNTSNWTSQGAPAWNNSTTTWQTGGTSAAHTFNGTGALVSDFSLNGDFTYTGTMRATADNDNMGIVFGWTDNSNHYRMGWEGGGFGDRGSSSQDGFWLIKESGGVDTVLANLSGLFWSRNVDYDFSITRTGNTIDYSIMNGAATVTSGSVVDGMFLSGAVGVYVESNASSFTNLAAMENNATVVPLPAALPLLTAGLGVLGIAGWRRRKS